MSAPTAKLAGFLESPGGVTITPGVDGFAALVPLAEPLSAGAPPVRPALLDGVMAGMRPARITADGAGYTGTAALATHRRPRLTVRWSGLTGAERVLLEGFFRADVGGTLASFDLEPDGEDAADVVQVRPLAVIEFQSLGRGPDGVLWSASVECEQVL